MDNWLGSCPNCDVGELYGDYDGSNAMCHICGWPDVESDEEPSE